MIKAQDEEAFAAEFKPDEFMVCYLWHKKTGRGAFISVSKEIIFEHGGAKTGTVKDGESRCKVFNIYNHLDPAKAYNHKPGCCVNQEPLYDFQAALRIAKEYEAVALESGEWLTLEELEDDEVESLLMDD
jgi:hypothetical protein